METTRSFRPVAIISWKAVVILKPDDSVHRLRCNMSEHGRRNGKPTDSVKKMIRKLTSAYYYRSLFLFLVVYLGHFQMNLPQFFSDVLRRFGGMCRCFNSCNGAGDPGAGSDPNFGITMGIGRRRAFWEVVVVSWIFLNPTLVAIHPLCSPGWLFWLPL